MVGPSERFSGRAGRPRSRLLRRLHVVYHHATHGTGMPDPELTTINDDQARYALADDDSPATCLIRADEQRLDGRLRLANHLVRENW